MKLEWRPRAVADLEHLRAWIATEQPAAAERVASQILATAELVRAYPLLGRNGRASNTRELVVGGTPYLLIYRHTLESVIIIRVVHGAQRWPRRRNR